MDIDDPSVGWSNCCGYCPCLFTHYRKVVTLQICSSSLHRALRSVFGSFCVSASPAPPLPPSPPCLVLRQIVDCVLVFLESSGLRAFGSSLNPPQPADNMWLIRVTLTGTLIGSSLQMLATHTSFSTSSSLRIDSQASLFFLSCLKVDAV